MFLGYTALQLFWMVHLVLFHVLNILYFDIST